jgi:hypothetical protein
MYRETKRKPLSPPAPLPAWAHRAAFGFLVLAIMASASVFGGGRGNWVAPVGSGEFLALTSLALWARNRYWRALALVLNAVFLLGALESVVAILMQAGRGTLAPPEGAGVEEWMYPLYRYPKSVALSIAVGSLGFLAGLVTLLTPSIRAAFGLGRPASLEAGARVQPEAARSS